MFKKKIIKKVFEEEFDKDKMKQEILIKYEKKGKKIMVNFFKYAISICVIVLISGIFMLSNNNFKLKSDGKKEEYYKNDSKSNEQKEEKYINIVVNKINNIGEKKLDADIKVTPDDEVLIPWLDLSSDIKIPNDLVNFDRYSVYTRKDKTGEYNFLNCSVYEYYKKDSFRNIKISFSDQNKPLRDYYFSDESSKKSIINNNEITIYKYEEIYFAEFRYKGYNFDIETSNITMEELKDLLTSIIK